MIFINRILMTFASFVILSCVSHTSPHVRPHTTRRNNAAPVRRTRNGWPRCPVTSTTCVGCKRSGELGGGEKRSSSPPLLVRLLTESPDDGLGKFNKPTRFYSFYSNSIASIEFRIFHRARGEEQGCSQIAPTMSMMRNAFRTCAQP